MIRFHSWFRDVLYFIRKEGPYASSTPPIPPTVCEVSSFRRVLSVTRQTLGGMGDVHLAKMPAMHQRPTTGSGLLFMSF